ncbi:MAG: cadherin-like domain-containing protein [Sphingomonas sp.]|uniref:Ig-like domain-containing protein n=1 Tax=Sphingomonas sp. TaxID=28214 RepID=UPI00260B158E|nr:Ig-like domain-containing protein [Sphingomonas sp.]MDK2768449.1 cadherin-like domain-containing protein [Sphingomonas sp.]
MKRALIACLLVGTAGCSGGGDGSVSAPPSADTTPPVVTISGSQSTIQAGESVLLSVAANDAKDGAISTFTLSCDGGTLVGNLLTTQASTAAGTIRCTATARDAAGNAGSATVSIAVTVPTARLSLGVSSTTLQPLEWGVVLTDNLTLAATSYTGELGGKPVTLYRSPDGKGLAFVTPEGIAPGANRLQATINGKIYSFDVQMAAGPTISDPRTVVSNYFAAQRAELSSLLADPTIASTVKTQLTRARNDLDAGIAALATASVEEVRQAALSITVNANPLAAQSFNGPACDASASKFVLGVVWTVAAVAVTADGVASIPASGLVGVAVGAGGFVGAVLILKKFVLPNINNILEHCLTIDAVSFLPAASSMTGHSPMRDKLIYVSPLAGTLTFRNKQPTTVRVERVVGLAESVAGQVKDSAGRLLAIGEQVGLVPDTLARLVSVASSKTTELVPPSTVSLSLSSGGKVTASYRPSGSDLVTTFSAVDPEPGTELINFTINVASSGNPTVAVPAQLSLTLPTAQDGSASAIQGRGIQSAVQASGQTSLEIVQQPQHGTLILQSSGSYSYTPAGNFFGQDSFRYRARNEDGYSRTATVMISVNRQFEGSWQVTLRSVTSSQSAPGLCPNETNVVNVGVSKVSDTLYTTSYAGQTLNLTMASKDDPAGLSGSWSGTYEDDPGQTTETVNIRIPDSNTITGSTSWSYRGPNGSSCSGSVTITGRRP